MDVKFIGLVLSLFFVTMQNTIYTNILSSIFISMMYFIITRSVWDVVNNRWHKQSLQGQCYTQGILLSKSFYWEYESEITIVIILWIMNDYFLRTSYMLIAILDAVFRVSNDHQNLSSLGVFNQNGMEKE